MTRDTPPRIAAALAALCLLGTGCQQKMAEQPYYRAYVPTTSFPDGRSNRPLEPGVIHRAQAFEDNALVTGLTSAEWGRARKYGVAPKPDAKPQTDQEKIESNIGAPRYNPTDAGLPQVFVKEFPIEIGAADLRRGRDRYTAFCAECHGPLGNGQGKIWERGYLKPTSFHTAPVEGNEPAATGDIPLGFSRGFWRWGNQVPMRDAPIGYLYEVISKGYGGMPDYSVQVAPADRWRIIAYVRTLQLSQHADVGALPESIRGAVTAAATGGK